MVIISAEADSNLFNIFEKEEFYYFVGLILCIIIFFIISYFSKKISGNIEEGVMKFSFFIAIFCLVASILFKEVDKSVNILSFFCSFIFSWLLTKKSSKEEFKERQQEIAKTSYRHIGDVKKTTLVTRNRLLELKTKGEMSRSDIDGILDDIDIILQCIATNEEDWEDMVSEDYLKQMKKDKDPEDEEENENEGKGSNKDVIQPIPDSIEALKNAVENVNKNIKKSKKY